MSSEGQQGPGQVRRLPFVAGRFALRLAWAAPLGRSPWPSSQSAG
jgi:hypothetical protein